VAAPLADVSVLDLTRLLPGPFCTMLLGDLGADVVKLEPLEGDPTRVIPPLVAGTSALFHALNRNKRSIAVDLRSAPGREIALRLAARSDVVVEGFRPGVLERLGLGYAELCARNPRIVLCRISGWGQDGPYRQRAGHDLDYLAAAGILAMSGSGTGPIIPGVQIGDLGGAQAAVVAILAALHERDRSSMGQSIDVSIFDTLLSWLSIHAAAHFARAAAETPGAAASEEAPPGDGRPSAGPGGPRPEAAPGGTLSGRHPCYRVYRCADGHLAVAALEPRFWSRLVELLGLPELAGTAFADGDEAEAVAAQVEAVLLGRTAREWMERLAGEDVCVEPVRDLAAALRHPQAESRGAVLAAGLAGPLPQPGFPFRMARTPAAVRRPAPLLGEHGAELLREIGYGEADAAALRAQGVVR
jgi:alpha-methylacyl-CoA racemase